MLSQIVLIQQFLLHGRNAWLKHYGMEVHERDLLQHHGIVDGVHGIDAPCKWTVAVYKNRWDGIRIFPLEGFLDDGPGFLLVFTFDLDFCHFSGARDLTVEIIALRCAERQDAATCLRKDC